MSPYRYVYASGTTFKRTGGFFRLCCAVAATPGGDVYAIGTEKGWVEFRITPSGLIRVGEFQRGKHPYFTVKEEEDERCGCG